VFALVFTLAVDGFGQKPRIYLASVLSAVLTWTAYFPLNWWGVAFVAMAPFLVLVRAEGVGRWRRYTAAWVGGLTFGTLAVNWLRHAHPAMALFAWPGVALFLSIWWPIGLFLLRRLDRFGKPPLALTFPVVWVALEYSKAHFPTGYPFLKAVGLYYPSGFPWYFLGHTQHANIPLLQSADLGGVYLITAAVGAVNGAVHDWVLRVRPFRRLVNLPRVWQPPIFRSELMATAGAVLVVGGLMAYGAFRLVHPPFEVGPKVAVLQDDIPQAKLMSDPEYVFSRYDKLSRDAARSNPDLIVWPEACFPYKDVTVADGKDPNPVAVMERIPPSVQWYWAVQETTEQRPFIDPARLSPEEQSRADLANYRQLLALGRRGHAATFWRTHVLIGSEAIIWDARALAEYTAAREQGATAAPRLQTHNSARMLKPDGTPGPRYDKTHLVPWGEYVPFRDQFPALAALSPSPNDPMCRPGETFTRFPLPVMKRQPGGGTQPGRYTFGVIICYEDTDPTIARRYNQWSGEPDPADFLVNQSLDSWFGVSEELEQHLAISRFRAVEARRPLVRAVNNGISVLIDGDGRVVELPNTESADWADSKNFSRAMVVDIPLDGRGSPYAAVGDWVPLLCWVGMIAGFVTLRLTRRKAAAPQ
jgi:apolipoprotein N-acyltransferase